MQQAGSDAPRTPLGFLLLQRIDQIDRGVEAHPFAVLGDGRNAQRAGQVRLARAGAADQHHVVGLVGERQAGQLTDQHPLHRRGLEVEAGQVTVHGESGRLHLVGHRAHRPVHAFGLQQVLQQPASTLQRRCLPLAQQIIPGAGHAVQPQALEFAGNLSSHGQPPGCRRRAVGRNGGCRHVAPRAAPGPCPPVADAADHSGVPARCARARR